jgi:hypothetical protein
MGCRMTDDVDKLKPFRGRICSPRGLDRPCSTYKGTVSTEDISYGLLLQRSVCSDGRSVKCMSILNVSRQGSNADYMAAWIR